MSDQNIQLVNLGDIPVYTLDEKGNFFDTKATFAVKVIVDIQKVHLDYTINNKGEINAKGAVQQVINGTFDYYKPLCFIVEGKKQPTNPILDLKDIEKALRKATSPVPINFSEVIDNSPGEAADFLVPGTLDGICYLPYVGYIQNKRRVGLSLKIGSQDDTTSLSAKAYKNEFQDIQPGSSPDINFITPNVDRILEFSQKNFNASKLAINCYGGSHISPESVLVPILYVTPLKIR